MILVRNRRPKQCHNPVAHDLVDRALVPVHGLHHAFEHRIEDLPSLLGDIAAHADLPDPEAAEGHYNQALARADELGMRPLAAHCHLGLGKFYSRTGDRAKATEHLTIAATMYREMDMGFWLEKAEAELGPPLGTHTKPG